MTTRGSAQECRPQGGNSCDSHGWALPSTAAVCAAPFAAQAQAPITIYCSILEEQCRVGVAAFEKATGAKATMVRKSTGETLAQIRAEASNPRADIWWGGPGDSHIQAAEEGLTVEYKSPKLPRAARLGSALRGTIGLSGDRHLSRRARHRLQHEGAPEPRAARAEMLGRSARSEIPRRGAGLGSELLRHGLCVPRLARAADGRGQGLRLHEEPAQERQSIHQVGRRSREGRGARRDRHRHRVHARHGDDDRRRSARQNPRALRGHRLRDRLDLRREGRQEYRNGSEIRGLGPLGGRAEARRRGPEDLFDRVEQERARLKPMRRSSPR